MTPAREIAGCIGFSISTPIPCDSREQALWLASFYATYYRDNPTRGRFWVASPASKNVPT